MQSGIETVMETKLERRNEILELVKRNKLTVLYHCISYELLKKCHKELSGKKVVRMDKFTKDEYEKKFGANLKGM